MESINYSTAQSSINEDSSITHKDQPIYIKKAKRDQKKTSLSTKVDIKQIKKLSSKLKSISGDFGQSDEESSISSGGSVSDSSSSDENKKKKKKENYFYGEEVQ